MLKALLFFVLYLTLTRDAAAQFIGLDSSKDNRGIKVQDFGDPAKTLGAVIQNIITLLFTVGALGFVIMFVWGAVEWILSGGDKEKIAHGRKRITTAIAGIAVLSLTYVVMLIVGQVFGIGALQTGQFTIPKLL